MQSHQSHKLIDTMPRAKQERISAHCTVLLHKLHPGIVISVWFTNMGTQEKRQDLIVVKVEVIQGGHVHLIDCTLLELICSAIICLSCWRWQQSPFLWGTIWVVHYHFCSHSWSWCCRSETMDDAVFHSENTAEDITIVRNQGLDINDNNSLVSVKISTINMPITNSDGL